MPGGVWLTTHTFPNGLTIDLQWDFLHDLIATSRRRQSQYSMTQRLAMVIPEFHADNAVADDLPNSYLRYRILATYLNLPLGAIILHCRNANFLIEAEDGTWHPSTAIWQKPTWFYQCTAEIADIHRAILRRHRLGN